MRSGSAKYNINFILREEVGGKFSVKMRSSIPVYANWYGIFLNNLVKHRLVFSGLSFLQANARVHRMK